MLHDDKDIVKVTDRRKYNLRELTYAVILIGNLCGGIWAVSAWKTTVRETAKNTDAAVSRIEKAVTNLDNKNDLSHDGYELRLRLIESDIAVVKARIFLLDQATRGQ